MEKTSAIHRLVRNSTTTMIARMSSQVSRIVVIMILARYLSKAQFGDYTYILALVGSFQVLADFGLNKIAVREIAKQRDKAGEYFGSVLILKATLMLISLFVLVVIANLSSHSDYVRQGLYLYGSSLILSFFASTYYVLYRAFERMQYEALLVFVESGIRLGLIILLVRANVGFVQLFWASMTAVIIKLILGTWLVYKKFILPKINFDWALYKMYLRKTLPVGIGQIVNSFSLRVDIIILGLLASSESVGIFSGPYRIVDTVGFIATVLITALFPVMSRRSVMGKEKMREFLQNSIRILMIIAIPASIGLAILAQPVVRLILGKEFPESIPVLQVLTLIILPTYFRILFAFAFVAVDKQVEFAYISGGVLLLNIVIDLLLIPWLGYWGACIGAISAEVTRMVLCSLRIKRYVGMLKVWGNITWPIIPSGIMAFVIWGLSSRSWIFALIIGAGVYVFFTLLVGLSRKEKDLLIQTLPASTFSKRIVGWFLR